MSGQKSKRILGAFAITIIVTVFASMLAWFNPLLKQQLYLSNFLYYERPTENQVVIVSIDDEAVSAEGLGKFASWCRSYYIPVLKRLAEYQPTVVGIDILFLSKSEGLCKDDLDKVVNSSNIETEIRKYADNLAHPTDLALGEELAKYDNLVLPLRTFLDRNDVGHKLGKSAYFKYPLQTLTSTSTLFGHNRFYVSNDGFIRSMVPDFIKDDNSVLSFSLKIVATYLGFSNDYLVDITNDSLILRDDQKSLQLPLENSQLFINYNEKHILESTYNGNTIIIPFMDLYRGEKDFSKIIKDKIVLIGDRSSSSSDKYKTPIDPETEMHGVVIHAQAIQTILDKAWLYTQPFWQQIATIALLALISIALIFMLQITLALPLLVLLIALYAAGLAPLLFRSQGLILNLVYPPLAIISTAIVGYAYRYVTEFKQKTKVTGALGQYVNKEVAQSVLDQDSSEIGTGGDNKEITVLFTDIKGFTSISENMRPESVVALLNEYFEVMTTEIVKQDGIIDKFEGDALMAFFEDKPGFPHHPIRAAHAALKMREALSRLMAKWKNDPPLPGGENKPQLDFRLGLSTGEAVVGNIGSANHIQYTVIGDIVNLGSRLESANKKYQTSAMMSDVTYEAIQNKYDCRFLDVIKVKGKEKPVKIYELLAPKGQLSPEQTELIQAYNKALALYFEREFKEAHEVLTNEVLQKWPADYLANLYAGRCELLMRFPPAPDWDFIYKMENK